MRIKKLLLPLIFTLSLPLSAQVYSKNQMLYADSWVYDALLMLSNETKITTFATDSPLSASELCFYLDLIPYEKLSDSGKKLYSSLSDYLFKDKSEKPYENRRHVVRTGNAFFGIGTDITPAFLYKSNSDMDWFFATDYTGKKNSLSDYNLLSPSEYRSDMNYDWSKIDEENRPVIQNDVKEYGATSSFYGSDGYRSVVTIPVSLGWSDYFFMQADPGFSKSFWGMQDDSNLTNVFWNGSDMDFLWPRKAYGCTGLQFSGWGVNTSFSRSSMQVGKTLTGSAVYNSTFETEGVFQLNLYSPKIKYNMDLVQVNTNKFLYLHSINVRPYFDNLRVEVVEGTLVNAPFELKFINPLMIMHSYGSWTDSDYFTEMEGSLYGEAHICQYMGFHIDYSPFKNSRIYFLYTQNEVQPPNELGSANGRAMPDSLGFQLGFEYTHPDKNDRWWKFALEGVYTTPFCYMKQGASWSLYSERYDMQSNGDVPLRSWIGSPFGPDAIGAEAFVSCTEFQKWDASFSWLFVAHGTNSFGLLDNTIEIDGKKYYAYYPSVLRKMGLISDEESENIARSWALTGTIQYTNRVSAKLSYKINEKIDLETRMTYSFIFNNKNESGEFAQGIEAFLMLSYMLF